MKNDIIITIDYDQGHFTTINNYHFQDQRLLVSERFLLTYLMYVAQMPYHHTSISGLAKELGVKKRDTIARWMHTLETYEYVTVVKDQVGNIVNIGINAAGDGKGCPKMGQGCPKMGQGGARKWGTNNIYNYNYNLCTNDSGITDNNTAATAAEHIKPASGAAGVQASAKRESIDSVTQPDDSQCLKTTRRKAVSGSYKDDPLFCKLYKLLPRLGRKINAYDAYCKTQAKYNIQEDEWLRMITRFRKEMAGRDKNYVVTPPTFFGEGTRGGCTCLNYRDDVYDDDQEKQEYYKAEETPDTQADLSKLADFVKRNS